MKLSGRPLTDRGPWAANQGQAGGTALRPAPGTMGGLDLRPGTSQSPSNSRTTSAHLSAALIPSARVQSHLPVSAQLPPPTFHCDSGLARTRHELRAGAALPEFGSSFQLTTTQPPQASAAWRRPCSGGAAVGAHSITLPYISCCSALCCSCAIQQGRWSSNSLQRGVSWPQAGMSNPRCAPS